MGYNIYTKVNGDRVRYTEWVGYKDNAPVWSENAGVELYNHSADPGENFNIAQEPNLKGVVAELSEKLHAGWRAVIHDVDIPQK